jgi:hypothetical protein
VPMSGIEGKAENICAVWNLRILVRSGREYDSVDVVQHPESVFRACGNVAVLLQAGEIGTHDRCTMSG